MATNLIRDPVHDFIPFSAKDKLDQLLLDLMRLPELQRLRRVCQVGFTSLVYPGATHSRFSHSIGVMHVARQVLTHLTETGKPIPKDDIRAVVCSALLHDIGHGPFSHSFEQVSKSKHVVWSEKIIKCKRVSSKLGAELTGRIADFINPTPKTSYLSHIISSQLDADRFDYLLRDNIMTGAQYGHYDLGWILNCLRSNPQKNRLEVSSKGKLTIEGYLQARYHMYRNVYYHKTVRAAEVMFKKIFERANYLTQNGDKLEGDPIFTAISKGQSISLRDYQRLDDAKVWGVLSQWASGKRDKVLSDLSSCLINRKLFKAVVDEPTDEKKNMNVFTSRHLKISNFFKKVPQGDFLWQEEEVIDTPYRPYSPDDKNPMTSIYIQTKNGEPEEISKTSKPIEALTRHYGMYRIFVHAKHADRVKQILEEKDDKK